MPRYWTSAVRGSSRHSDPPVVKLDGEKAKEWIGKGAQPSEAAEKILVRAGVIEKKAVRVAAPAEAAPAKAGKAPATAGKAEAPVATAEAPVEAEAAAGGNAESATEE